MRNIFKQITAAAAAAAMMLTFCAGGIAAGNYTVEDAYAECCEVYPEFAENVKAQGVTDEQILVFLNTIYEYLLNYEDTITEDNFDSYLLDAVNAAISLRKNMAVRDAIMRAYNNAAVAALDGIIAPELQPVYEMAKSLIFDNGLLGDESTSPSSETATTPTEAPTTPTTPATEEPSTMPTEAPTAPSTEAATSGTPSGTGEVTEPSTAATAPTEAPTDDADAAEESDEPSAPTQSDISSPTEAPTSVKFTDMGSVAWAEDAVYALAEMGIVAGYGDGTFLPNKSITRAEFAKIIVLASGRYDANASADFKDVKSGDWYYSYVASAKNLGLVNGRDDGSFDPNSNITRADICTIVYRYIKSVNSEFGKDAGAAAFSDFAKVPSYAQEAVRALSAAGIVSGMGDNRFEPLSNATRAQSAKIVYGAIKAALQI